MDTKPCLWLRAERKPNEARTPITPSVAESLIHAGYSVVVERSKQRAFGVEQYESVGCRVVDEHSWQEAPLDAIIIGLKELSAELGPFQHRHVHFAHVYKEQLGWQAFLQQFGKGSGHLYDLEYLVDESGKRVAAFGYWAGYVGAAIALLTWISQRTGNALTHLTPWSGKAQLQQSVKAAFSQLTAQNDNIQLPKALVIGAKGRSGGGAVELFRAFDVSVVEWDMAETQAGGPFDAILDNDILVNCVFLSEKTAPFTTLEHLDSPNRRLSVISDVSCDPFSDANPLPIYTDCTTMAAPTIRIIDTNTANKKAANGEAAVNDTANSNGVLPLDLISIDHLPSLLPTESSTEFSEALLPYLLTLDKPGEGVWQRAHQVFQNKLALASQQEN